MTGNLAPRPLPVILRHPAFGAVWGAQVLTQASGRMFQVGVVWWLVSHAAGSERGLASGLFLAVSTLPAVALAPLVARIIARTPHRKVMSGAAVVAGLVAAVTAGWSYVTPPPLSLAYAAALMLAGCQALFDPCLTTAVPDLVDEADIEAATGFELSTQSLAGLGGGLLGPLVVDAWQLSGIVTGCACAYLLAGALVAATRFLRLPAGPALTGAQTAAAAGMNAPPATGPAPVEPVPRTLRQVLAGLPFVRRVLLCFTAANLFTTAVYVVMPLYTRSVLHAHGSTVAALEAALGAGALAGSFTGARLPGAPANVGGACLALMAAALGLPGVVADRVTAVGALAVAGWCVGVLGVRFVALFQRLVPAADKPAFFAMMQALLGAAFPVSSLAFGALAERLSPQVLCLVQAAGLAPVAALLWWCGRIPANGPDAGHTSDPEPATGTVSPARAADRAGDTGAAACDTTDRAGDAAVPGGSR